MWSVPLLVCLALTDAPALPTHPAPVYQLPADGTWAEYRWRGTDARGKPIAGTLRISSVGRQTIKSQAHRWIELKLRTEGRPETKVVWRKMLVAESAFKGRVSLVDRVAVCYSRIGANGAIKRVPPGSANSVMSMGTWQEEASLSVVNASERIEVAAGRFSCMHVASKTTKPARFVYEGWLSAQAPFGWAKIVVFENHPDRPPRMRFFAEQVRDGR